MGYPSTIVDELRPDCRASTLRTVIQPAEDCARLRAFCTARATKNCGTTSAPQHEKCAIGGPLDSIAHVAHVAHKFPPPPFSCAMVCHRFRGKMVNGWSMRGMESCTSHAATGPKSASWQRWLACLTGCGGRPTGASYVSPLPPTQIPLYGKSRLRMEACGGCCPAGIRHGPRVAATGRRMGNTLFTGTKRILGAEPDDCPAGARSHPATAPPKAGKPPAKSYSRTPTPLCDPEKYPPARDTSLRLGA
jgi:hypothetical protein